MASPSGHPSLRKHFQRIYSLGGATVGCLVLDRKPVKSSPSQLVPQVNLSSSQLARVNSSCTYLHGRSCIHRQHVDKTLREEVVSVKVSKGAKIRNRYNQVPHLTQDTNGKATNSKLDTTNENQEVSPFPAGDYKAHINRRAQRHSKHKTEQKHKTSALERSVKYFTGGLKPV